MIAPGSGFMLGSGAAVGWVTELGGATNAASLSGCIPQGDNVIAIGSNDYVNETSGDVLAMAFKKLDGSVVWQEKINAVTAQQISYGGPVLSSGGKIKFAKATYFAADTNNYHLELNSLNADGTLNTASNIATLGSLPPSNTPGIDGSDNLYIPVTVGNFAGIYKFDSSGGFTAAKKINSNFGHLCCIQCYGSNLIFAQDSNALGTVFLMSVINDLSTINWAKEILPITTSGGNFPYSISIDGSGNIYLLCGLNPGRSELHKYDPSGNLLWALKHSTSAVPGAAIVLPGGVCEASSGGNVSPDAGVLMMIDPSGGTIWGARFKRAGLGVTFTGIQADADSLYVTGYLTGAPNIPFIMKVPISTPIPAGTYGNWTVDAFSNTVSTTPTVTGASITLSAPIAAGASASPTVTATSFTPTTTVL